MTPVDESRRRQRRQAAREPQGVEIPFGRKNYILFGIAAVVILAGYIALSRGSITLAPILLLTGYLGLIPGGILAK
jgi:hypothetical protein